MHCFAFYPKIPRFYLNISNTRLLFCCALIKYSSFNEETLAMCKQLGFTVAQTLLRTKINKYNIHPVMKPTVFAMISSDICGY